MKYGHGCPHQAGGRWFMKACTLPNLNIALEVLFVNNIFVKKALTYKNANQ